MAQPKLVYAGQEIPQSIKNPLAERLGFEAYHKNIPLRQNPYRVDCVEQWQLWRKGWQDASGQPK
jgi:hypothetical protein